VRKRCCSLLPILATLASAVPANAQGPASPDRGFAVVDQTFVALLVADAQAAAAWYRDVLALTEVNRIEAEDGRYAIRVLEGQGLTVELIRLEGVGPAPTDRTLGLFKAGFYVDDIDAAYAWLASRDADVDPGIFHDKALASRSFLFRDPWGNRLQLFQRCDDDCLQE